MDVVAAGAAAPGVGGGAGVNVLPAWPAPAPDGPAFDMVTGIFGVIDGGDDMMFRGRVWRCDYPLLLPCSLSARRGGAACAKLGGQQSPLTPVRRAQVTFQVSCLIPTVALMKFGRRASPFDELSPIVAWLFRYGMRLKMWMQQVKLRREVANRQ